jgi:hypothetical protein
LISPYLQFHFLECHDPVSPAPNIKNCYFNLNKLLLASVELSSSNWSSLQGKSLHSIQDSYFFLIQHVRILHKLSQKKECLLFVLHPSQITYSGLTSSP